MLLSVNLFLQIQRKLQLRIEEQGRYLQMLFEKQKKPEDPDECDPSRNITEATEQHQATKGLETTNPSSSTGESSQDTNKKQKASEARTPDDDASDEGEGLPSMKRARGHETSQ